MLVSTIKQFGLKLCADPEQIPFRFSENLQMQFVKDSNYEEWNVSGFYKTPGADKSKLLEINEEGIFELKADCFNKRGTLSFSFSLQKDEKQVHLGIIEFEVRESFGDGSEILPEDPQTWIAVVSNVAKDAIKEDVELIKEKAIESSNNAKSALESAGVAQSSANAALEAEKKALEFASSAERFKNSASNFAEQANASKTEAQQSAKDASNSASSALQNANKAKEHLDSVNTAVSDFNTDYTEKINEFNTNYTTKKEAFDTTVNSANTALNATITEANTSINSKVAEASAQANIAKQEADRATLATDGKLDKNQGTDNAGKAMVVDEEGNIIPGEAGINNDEVNALIDSAIKEKLYTQEEVDYLLRDKMDKPYTPVTLTDNTTIDCTLAGNFKIDSIEGNTVQDVEENIVPTPARPIPIISKKTLANGDYVELRSLKESENLFDLGIQNQIDLIPNTDAYRQIDIPVVLKTKTTYAFKFDDFEIPAKMWVVLKIVNNDNVDVLGITNTKNDSNEQITIQSKTSFFNTNENSEFYFSYYVAIQDEETKRWLQSEETFKNYWYTKLIKNIMLVEGTDAPSNYIPSTVRDYKIVDHTNKKAWIERNVQEVNINSLVYSYAGDNGEGVGVRFYASVKPTLKFANEIYSNIFISYSAYDYTKESIYGGNSTGGKTLSIIVKESNISEHTGEALLAYINNPDTVAYYALETPIVEEIEYNESDTTEIGSSFQDSTSPSPSIPSEIKGVDKITVKAVGKNLLKDTSWNEGKYLSGSNGELLKGDKNISSDYIDIMPYTSYTISINTNFHSLGYAIYDKDKQFLKYLSIGSRSALVTPAEYDAKYIRVFFNINNTDDATYEMLSLYNPQLEVGDTATEYEPYKESSIKYELDELLQLHGDDTRKDVITANNRKNNISFYVLSGAGTWINSTHVHDDYIGFVREGFMLAIDPPSNTYNSILMCDKLKVVHPYEWDDDIEAECITVTTARNLCIKIKKTRLDELSINGFKKWLQENPLEIVYEVSTPTTEPLPEDLVTGLKGLRTYSPTTHVFLDGEVKPTVNAEYPKDLLLAQQKLEETVLTLQEEVVKNV